MRRLLALCSLVCLLACGGKTDQTESTAPCPAGQSRPCTCPGATAQGTQACLSDGSFGSCSGCPSSAGGAGGAGLSGGSGGAGGSGQSGGTGNAGGVSQAGAGGESGGAGEGGEAGAGSSGGTQGVGGQSQGGMAAGGTSVAGQSGAGQGGASGQGGGSAGQAGSGPQIFGGSGGESGAGSHSGFFCCGQECPVSENQPLCCTWDGSCGIDDVFGGDCQPNPSVPPCPNSAGGSGGFGGTGGLIFCCEAVCLGDFFSSPCCTTDGKCGLEDPFDQSCNPTPDASPCSGGASGAGGSG